MAKNTKKTSGAPGYGKPTDDTPLSARDPRTVSLRERRIRTMIEAGIDPETGEIIEEKKG